MMGSVGANTAQVTALQQKLMANEAQIQKLKVDIKNWEAENNKDDA